jgi:hypothetical protein
MADEQEGKKEKRARIGTIYLTNKVVTGGFIAINVIILQALITIHPLDGYLHTSVIAISIALPLLSAHFALNDAFVIFKRAVKDSPKFNYTESKIRDMIQDWIGLIAAYAGYIATLIGITAALNHILPGAGQAFITLSIVLICIIPILAVATFIDTFRKLN